MASVSLSILEEMVIRSIRCVFEQTMEDLVGRVVRKELEEAQLRPSASFKGNPENEIYTSNLRCLKLKFLQSVTSPVLTGEEIKGEGGSVLRVALLDDLTGEVVETGSEASSEIEILALQGEFDEDYWTSEVFSKYIKTVNNANKSLLVGKVRLKLSKGIGDLQNVKFRHCSDWMSKCTYKLGARVIDTSSGTIVKEAITESFTVKDRRGQCYEKHDPPRLSDDVWRLKNIGRGGKIDNRLKEKQVKTVEDFLVLLLRDSEQLKSRLHIPAKLLEETVNHARRCIIDNRVYYHIDSENTGVVFNIVGEVVGLVLQCQYKRAEKLSIYEKAIAEKRKESACRQWEDIVTFGDEKSLEKHLKEKSSSPSDYPNLECHNDREVLIRKCSHSPPETTFQCITNSVKGSGSTILSYSPIYSSSSHYFMLFMEMILNGNFKLVFIPPHNGSLLNVRALNVWKMGFHELRNGKTVLPKAHEHWGMVFNAVKSTKRKRAEALVFPDVHLQKSKKSVDQEYASKWFPMHLHHKF